MTVRLSTGLRNTIVGATGFGATFEKGVIHIYSGPQPLNADNAITGTLLGTVTIASGAFVAGAVTNGLTFAAPSGGSIAKTGTWSFNGVAAGTAGWFRLVGNAADAGALSAVLPRLDGSVGNSGADLNLSNLAIVVGAPTTIDSFSFTIPAQ